MRANELAQKLETYGKLKTEEYVELQDLIRAGELPEWHELYRSQWTTIKHMHDLVYHLLWKTDDEHYNAFFNMKDLVEHINAWYEIDEPYKPSHKIAYGWQFAMDKGFSGFRPYLYGCIKNYLNRNNVEWKTLELQIICNFKDLAYISNDGQICKEWEGVNVY